MSEETSIILLKILILVGFLSLPIIANLIGRKIFKLEPKKKNLILGIVIFISVVLFYMFFIMQNVGIFGIIRVWLVVILFLAVIGFGVRFIKTQSIKKST
jgi:hypothetical protein